MTARVASLLSAGAWEDSERRRVLKFALLGEYLCAPDQEFSPEARGYETFFQLHRDRNSYDFLKQGTPFFWKNALRCFAAAVMDRDALKPLVDHMLRTAFDSYFDWLPDGFAFTFARCEAALVLPRLGVTYPSENQSVMVRRLGPSGIRIETTGGAAEIDLDDIDERFRIPTLDIAGYPSAKLLLCKNPTLFEEPYIENIAPTTVKASFLAAMVSQSLAMIELVDPTLGQRLTKLLRWFVPISSPGAETHNSFSVVEMPGVVFLSEAYNDMRLAEAIVHEFHHNELYLLQEAETLFDNEYTERLYSPWRPDPRPLDGLMHALHVFSGVADFLARAERSSLSNGNVQSLYGRRLELVRQLRFGLAQVPWERLTAPGESVLRSVEEDVLRHEQDLGPMKGALPPVMMRHLSTWRIENPQLSHNIKVPDGVTID